MAFVRSMGVDPWTGVETTFIQEDDSEFHIETSQRTDAVLGSARRMRDASDGKSHDMYLVATVPLTLLHQWSIECGHPPFTKEFSEYVARKKINNSEFNKFRVWGGHV